MRPLSVVTGATKGIGRAVVEKFLAEGFDVVACARDASALDELKKSLSSHNGQVFTKPTDLSVRQDVEAFGRFVLDLKRPISVLVNNTGVFLPGQIGSEAEGNLEKMMNTNLYSVYYLTRALLPNIIETPHSHIFNICSTASITAYTNGGSYCISKFALYGLTKVLREEMKPHNVKVTAILPGATLTDSWAGTDLPPSRFMEANDIAHTIWAAYQLSPSAVIEEILMRPQLGDI